MVKEWLVRRYGPSRASVRRMIQKYATDSEGGQLYSPTLREIFRVHWGVDVGLYTLGGCFRPYQFGRNTTIGRYSSIAVTAFAATDNHPMEWRSTHGFFFNPVLGVVSEKWHHQPLRIGNDVWMGHNSVIMPGVSEVGDGAVIAAGAVVNKDIPPYAVVVGNPGRVVRFRFDPATIERLLAETWWEEDLAQVRTHLSDFTRPLDPPVSTGESSAGNERSARLSSRARMHPPG